MEWGLSVEWEQSFSLRREKTLEMDEAESCTTM